jgi:hypothetical protein
MKIRFLKKIDQLLWARSGQSGLNKKAFQFLAIDKKRCEYYKNKKGEEE